MKDYYEILEVDTESTPEQIKRAFRKKAKELHPDLSHAGSYSAEKLHLLIQAYETLSDARRREEYDRTFCIVPSGLRFDYREFLKERPDDLGRQSRLIFYDLLHSNSDDAISLYEALSMQWEFDLSTHLDREDYMDCAFLLAEALEEREEYVKAYRLYRSVISFEMEKPYFRHFFEEVTERLRTLVCFKMPESVSNEIILQCLNELVIFDFSRKDTAFYLKKAAEIYTDRGQFDVAAHYLQRGLELDSKLSGVKKLKTKIGFPD